MSVALGPGEARLLRLIRVTDPLSKVAFAVLLFMVGLGVVGPFLPIGHASAVGAAPRLSPPSLVWPMGTDALGRSQLPRVIEGVRLTFALSGFAVLLTSFVGILLGLVAGYFRSISDEIIVRGADILFSFPTLLLAVLVAAILGPGSPVAIATVILITLPLMMRVVRAATIVSSGRDFIVVALISGASPLRIILRHLLPGVAGAAVVQATYAISIGMIVESAISFLGLGVQPPDSSLGSLLREGSAYLVVAPWLVFIPGILLSAVILSLNLVGDGLRDLFNPQSGSS